MTLKHEKTEQALHLPWYVLLWLHPLTLGAMVKTRKRNPPPFISKSFVQDLDKVFFCWFLGAIKSDNKKKL